MSYGVLTGRDVLPKNRIRMNYNDSNNYADYNCIGSVADLVSM